MWLWAAAPHLPEHQILSLQISPEAWGVAIPTAWAQGSQQPSSILEVGRKREDPREKNITLFSFLFLIHAFHVVFKEEGVYLTNSMQWNPLWKSRAQGARLSQHLRGACCRAGTGSDILPELSHLICTISLSSRHMVSVTIPIITSLNVMDTLITSQTQSPTCR